MPWRWVGGVAVAVWLAGAGVVAAGPRQPVLSPGFATSGGRVVSVALVSPLAASGDTDGPDDSGAGYSPSSGPISVPHGSSSDSSSSSGSVPKGAGSEGGSDDEDTGGGILGWVKNLVGGASNAAASGAAAGAQGGEGSPESPGGNLASEIVSKVFSGVKSALSHVTSGGN